MSDDTKRCCPKCGGPLTILFTSVVCDACDPPSAPVSTTINWWREFWPFGDEPEFVPQAHDLVMLTSSDFILAYPEVSLDDTVKVIKDRWQAPGREITIRDVEAWDRFFDKEIISPYDRQARLVCLRRRP